MAANGSKSEERRVGRIALIILHLLYDVKLGSKAEATDLLETTSHVLSTAKSYSSDRQ